MRQSSGSGWGVGQALSLLRALFFVLSLSSATIGLTACDGCDGGRTSVVSGVAAFDPGEADFGYVIIGQQGEVRVQVRNAGRGQLKISSIDRAEGFPDEIRYAPSRMTLEAGEEQTLTLYFEPREQGERRGDLVFRTDDTNEVGTLAVHGIGVNALLRAEPSEVDFGTIVLGEIGEQTAQIFNDADFPLNVFIDPMAGDNPEVFRAAVPGPDQRTVRVEAHASLSVAMQFQPATVGMASARLNVRPCSACDPLSIRLVGKGVAAGIVAIPEALDFGATLPGFRSTKSLMLKNIGTRAITIRNVRPAVNGEFSLVAPAGGWPEMSPQQEISFDVSYLPTGIGSDLSHLVVETSDARTPSFQVPVSGYGGGPKIEVTPLVADFGTVAVGFPVSRRLVISNKGANDGSSQNDDLVISALEVPVGEFSYSLPADVVLPIRIVPGGRQVVEVKYDPTDENADASELRVTSNDTANPLVSATLRGRGRAVSPCNYEVTPAAATGLNFGVVGRARQSRRSFALRNLGTNDCIIGKIDVAAAYTPANISNPFSLPGGPVFGRVLAPGERLVTEVEFAPPTQAASGTAFTGAIDLGLSSVTAPTQSLQLKGRTAEVCLQISPSGVDFGVVEPNCETNDRVFTIYNACSGPVNIQNVSIGGSSEFRIILPSNTTLPRRLDSRADLKFSVRYRPTDIGPDNGTVEILTDQRANGGDPYVLPLAGRGEVDARYDETFVQADRARADILFVVDDSGSMSEEQTTLGQNFSSFMQFAIQQQIDYQIAVTNTATSAGCPSDNNANGRFLPLAGTPRIITPNTDDPSGAFRRNVDVGTSGCASEMPLEAAYLALSDPNLSGSNAGFLRPDAYLSVIVVTDEEDQSTRPVDFYVNYFTNLKGVRGANLVSVSGIVGTDPAECTGPGGSSEYVERVIQTARRTSGITESICSSNWSVALQRLGETAFGFKSRFLLTSQPDAATLRVMVDGVEYAAGSLWNFNAAANAIDFLPTAVPPAGSTIEVSYAVACN